MHTRRFLTPSKLRRAHSLCVFLLLAFLTLAGCQTGLQGKPPLADKDAARKVASWPSNTSLVIYIGDFALDAAPIANDAHAVSGTSARSRRKPEQQTMPFQNPKERAGTIVETVSRSLSKHLNDKGFEVHRLSGLNTAELPREGWLVQGVFTETGKGNKVRRAVIGSGRGAKRMEAQVAVSNLAGAAPKSPFIIFGTFKSPQRSPSAGKTRNPHVAAAKFVMEKDASETEIDKTAARIADEIVRHGYRFKLETLAEKP